MRWLLAISAGLLVSTTCIAGVVLYVFRRRRRYLVDSAREQKPLLDISDHTVVIIDSESQCEEYFSSHLQMQHKFIGLDCEWNSDNTLRHTDHRDSPSVEEHNFCAVALLQISFPTKHCALVRISKIGKITPSLMQLLQDRSVLKFGVGICNDAKRLTAGCHVTLQGVVELGNLAIRCGIRRNCSLAGLTNQVVGSNLVKDKSLTCSDWEQDQLTHDQITYAASDAIAAMYILIALVSRKLSHKRGHWGNDDITSHSILPSDLPLDLLYEDESAIKCTHSLCQGLIGVEYKQLSNRNIPLSDSTPGGASLPSSSPRQTSAYSVRKTPLYHNCQLKGPDGTLLSTVDQKKLDWYIRKGLGKLVSDDPPTVQLEFEPSGTPDDDRQYYLTEKENVCVVCGKGDSYIRKNVIPHEYRKHFPKARKEHMSHDVLLLCVPCHQLSDSYDRFMRRDVALQYGVQVDAGTQKYRDDPEKVRVRSFARALKGGRQLPESRKMEMLGKIAEYSNCEIAEITPDMIEELANVETRSLNTDFLPHGEQVVRVVLERGELTEFQRRWRIHFIETMKPRHLPKLWSVDHNPQS